MYKTIGVQEKSRQENLTGFVRMKGLEPIRRKTLDPKSSAATNYATSAHLSGAKL